MDILWTVWTGNPQVSLAEVLEFASHMSKAIAGVVRKRDLEWIL